MGLIKHFRDDGDCIPLSHRTKTLNGMRKNMLKKDNARLRRLIARYKTATPGKASGLLVDIHSIIDKYM